MNILVTGGAGFIGSHTIERLLERSDRVVCLDNFDAYYDPAIKERNLREASGHKNFRLVRGDIRDGRALEEAFGILPVDAVIHLAARAGVRPSLAEPELYYDVNITGTLRLLEAMRKRQVKRLIFGSSSSVYGNNRKVPFSETDPVDAPISPYAASKKAGELLCHTYHHLYGFHIFCLRFFTVYGPRQRPEMAIHQFTRKLLNHEKILLYGDGSSQRDYTYIEDIVDGVLRSLDRLNGYEIINLGESGTITLKALIESLERLTGEQALVQREPAQPGDVDTTYADIRKAWDLLGYNPRFPVEKGLAEFVEWYRNSMKTPGGV